MTNPRIGARLPIATAAIGLALLAAGCTGRPGTPTGPPPAGPVAGGHGPNFPLCGGIDDQTVAELIGRPGLSDAGKNSAGCEWHPPSGRYASPQIVFSWYRGSPMGRERTISESMGQQITDITIDGHAGFTGLFRDGDAVLCEVVVGFGDDFIEWSINVNGGPVSDVCGIAEELARRSIANTR